MEQLELNSSSSEQLSTNRPFSQCRRKDDTHTHNGEKKCKNIQVGTQSREKEEAGHCLDIVLLNCNSTTSPAGKGHTIYNSAADAFVRVPVDKETGENSVLVVIAR